MIVYVHSHDIHDAGRTFGRHARVRDVVHVTIPARESVAGIARRIIDGIGLRAPERPEAPPLVPGTGARSGPVVRPGPPVRHATGAIPDAPARASGRRSIWLLIFNSHGLPGRLFLGDGIDDTNVWDLLPLREYMTPGGHGVEIHACLVASAVIDPDGERRSIGVEFLQRMAHVLNVPVMASTRAQIGVEEGWLGTMPGSDTHGVFEGDFVRVEPNGGASLHAAPGTH